MQASVRMSVEDGFTEGAVISKDYALFYPGEKRPGGRTVAISLEKNAESSKFRKKAKIIILISSIGWSVLVSA